jgi:hypothetical protein
MKLVVKSCPSKIKVGLCTVYLASLSVARTV